MVIYPLMTGTIATYKSYPKTMGIHTYIYIYIIIIIIICIINGITPTEWGLTKIRSHDICRQ